MCIRDRGTSTEVSRTITESYLGAMYAGYTTLHDQLGSAADGAGKVASGAGDLANGASQAAAGAGKLASGSAQLADGADALRDGAAALATGAGQAASGAAQLASGMSTLDAKAAGLPAGTRQLADGAAALAAGAGPLGGAGGPLGRGYPILTLDQHQQDPVAFPFVTVAADIVLEGNKLKPGYGPRIHFYAWPKLVFRILDTGGAFKGEGKRIRSEGHEPFDIATNYAGTERKQIDRQKFSTYWIDWQDVLGYPEELRRKLTDELKRKYRTLPEAMKQKYGLAEAVS